MCIMIIIFFSFQYVYIHTLAVAVDHKKNILYKWTKSTTYTNSTQHKKYFKAIGYDSAWPWEKLIKKLGPVSI